MMEAMSLWRFGAISWLLVSKECGRIGEGGIHYSLHVVKPGGQHRKPADEGMQ